jgi:hypothetical protein
MIVGHDSHTVLRQLAQYQAFGFWDSIISRLPQLGHLGVGFCFSESGISSILHIKSLINSHGSAKGYCFVKTREEGAMVNDFSVITFQTSAMDKIASFANNF